MVCTAVVELILEILLHTLEFWNSGIQGSVKTHEKIKEWDRE